MWNVELNGHKSFIKYNNNVIGNISSIIIHMDAKRQIPELILKVVDPNVKIIAQAEDKNVKISKGRRGNYQTFKKKVRLLRN